MFVSMNLKEAYWNRKFIKSFTHPFHQIQKLKKKNTKHVGINTYPHSFWGKIQLSHPGDYLACPSALCMSDRDKEFQHCFLCNCFYGLPPSISRSVDGSQSETMMIIPPPPCQYNNVLALLAKHRRKRLTEREEITIAKIRSRRGGVMLIAGRPSTNNTL